MLQYKMKERHRVRWRTWAIHSDGEVIAFYNQNYIGMCLDEVKAIDAVFVRSIELRKLEPRIAALVAAHKAGEYPRD
jgi:hypothetical protein